MRVPKRRGSRAFSAGPRGAGWFHRRHERALWLEQWRDRRRRVAERLLWRQGRMRRRTWGTLDRHPRSRIERPMCMLGGRCGHRFHRFPERRWLDHRRHGRRGRARLWKQGGIRRPCRAAQGADQPVGLDHPFLDELAQPLLCIRPRWLGGLSDMVRSHDFATDPFLGSRKWYLAPLIPRRPTARDWPHTSVTRQRYAVVIRTSKCQPRRRRCVLDSDASRA
jgi:hypothetical protein